MHLKRNLLLFLTIIFVITLTVSGSARTKTLQSFDQIESIRILGANNIPVKVIVVYHPERNEKFVTGLINLVIQMHKEDRLTADNPFKVHIIPSPSAVRQNFSGLRKAFSDETLRKYVEFNREHLTIDIWMQDWGEVGTIKLKNQRKPQLLVVDSNRGRGNSKLPKLLSHFWNCYYVKNPSQARSGGDYGGNIEVTPDDILVIGNTSTKALREFFATHGYADKLAVVETDWLLVGHCDEYISIAPNTKDPIGYSLIKADPRLALRLIRKTPRKQLEQIPEKKYANMLLAVHDYLVKYDKENIYYSTQNQGLNDKFVPYPLVEAVKSIDDQGNMPEMYFDLVASSRENSSRRLTRQERKAEEFIKLNFSLATLIDSNIDAICDKVSQVRKDNKKPSIMSFPVFYHRIRGNKLIAYIPGTVNQLILNRYLVIPDPLIESFRISIAQTASRAGLKANFLNNMMYHTLQGEIHCGTNVFRHPNKYFVKPR
jgi:hypothetical protein